MTILTLNPGSTSLKYSIYQDKKLVENGKTNNHKSILKLFKPDVVLIRLVFYPDNQKLLIKASHEECKTLKKYNKTAPLHNKHAINLALSIINTPVEVYFVLDNNFHNTIELKSKYYPYSLELQKSLKIQKYGYHGLAVTSVMSQLATKNLIVCHLGGGSSITAIKNRVSIANSMGFLPNEGMMMVSRSGTVPYGVFKQLPTGSKQGFEGLTGLTDVKAIVLLNTPECKLALQMFTTQVASYIASYYLLLEGRVDSLVFTGGIGFNSEPIRKMIVDLVKPLGINSIKLIEVNEELEMVKAFSSAKL
jgi:acetate kinase